MTMNKPISYEAKINSQPLSNFTQDERELWYDPKRNMAGLFESVKYLKNKELMFLKGGIRVRWLRAGNFNFLLRVLRVFDIKFKKCTAYASLDRYRHIPMFTANLRYRKQETDAWIERGGNDIIGVDFGIDIDCKKGTWKDARKPVLALCQLLNKANCNYAIWRTTHGWHIVIPYEQTSIDSNGMSNDELRVWYSKIAEKINEKMRNRWNEDYIDMSAYMETRVFRAPYLLDCDDQVILPLSYVEVLEMFEKQYDLKPSFVLTKYRLKNRGVYINNYVDEGAFYRFCEEVEKWN